jgi:hypothetical protein
VTRSEKLLFVLSEILKAGGEYMKLSKKTLADEFERRFAGESHPTNRELVDAFMTARDRGWLDVISVESERT